MPRLTETQRAEVDVRVGTIRLSGDAYVYDRGERIVALTADLVPKYAEVTCCGSGDGDAPCVYLGATEWTIGNDPYPDVDTVVTFTSFVGWSVFSAHVSRYTLRVVLVMDRRVST